jgi:hypothetical protein
MNAWRQCKRNWTTLPKQSGITSHTADDVDCLLDNVLKLLRQGEAEFRASADSAAWAELVRKLEYADAAAPAIRMRRSGRPTRSTWPRSTHCLTCQN